MTQFTLSSLRSGFTRLLAVAAVLAFCGTAVAQNQQQFNEDQLDAFVEAAIKVSQVRKQWVPKIESAGSKEDAQKLSQQAVSDMRAAVSETNNISVEQYDAIATAVQEDEALRKRVDEKFKQQSGQ